MQIGNEQLKSQQQVMQALKFYKGKVDGIWGPDTIAAKIKWERSGTFAPGIPNNGFPLPERGPFPDGVRRNNDGTLTCIALDLKPAEKVEAPVIRVQNNQQNQGKIVRHDNKPQQPQQPQQPAASVPLNPEVTAAVPAVAAETPAP